MGGCETRPGCSEGTEEIVAVFVEPSAVEHGERSEDALLLLFRPPRKPLGLLEDFKAVIAGLKIELERTLDGDAAIAKVGIGKNFHAVFHVLKAAK